MSNSNSAKSDFGRKTWDEDEYAEKAKARREQRLTNDKYSKATSLNEFYKDRSKRVKQVDTYSSSNLVSSDKAKYAGFHCELCHRTFRDNLAYLSHLNEKEHLTKSGVSGLHTLKKYTVADVKKRLGYLREKVKEINSNPQNENNIRSSHEIQDERLERRRKKRQERRQKRKNMPEKLTNGLDTKELQTLMGFSNFGS